MESVTKEFHGVGGLGVLRLGRLPCGMPPAFRSAHLKLLRLRLGRRSRPVTRIVTESRRLSAREAAKPPKLLLLIVFN